MGFVGRMTKDKGVLDLLDAVRGLDATLKPTLLLVGASDEADAVPAAALRDMLDSGQVVMTGPVPDVLPYIRLMDLVVLPTYREGFPTVALEAYAMRRPLVTTDATGARDAVKHGETGLLVPVGDVARLRSAIEELGRDAPLRRKLGENGHAWLLASFDQRRICAALVELYCSWLPGGATRDAKF